ncbi:hypothetical protein [Spartinivicinus ruber]|uniref:hypothetical protein n=1 Tax=Spartinivicinus ruber TaxID=2683272 RepID=UPI0013D36D6F|nr:hypothetical protein [Spartinivicinus ruber]
MPNPVTGTQLINIDPNNKLVNVAAYAQSSGNQTVVIKNSSGKVVFQAQGKSSSGGELTSIGEGSFLSDGNGTYTVELTPNAGILPCESACVYQGAPYIHTYSFATNDGGANAGDKDFNDLYVNITIYKNKG